MKELISLCLSCSSYKRKRILIEIFRVGTGRWSMSKIDFLFVGVTVLILF